MAESLEPRENPRDQAGVPLPARREEEVGESARLVRVERDRGLGLFPSPDAETRVLRLREVDGDPKAAVADVGMALEVLDDLRPLRLAAVRAEAEVVLYRSSALPAVAHGVRSMPGRSSGQAERAAHDVHGRRMTRPELEARGSPGGEDLESVEQARARRRRGVSGRGARIREVDQRLISPELEQSLV